ncbi:MAG: S41 family peptidase [Chloroflexota bacterium]
MQLWKATLVILSLFLGSCALGSRPQQPTSAIATAYLNEVLDVVERRALNRHSIDWEQFRARLFAIAEGAQTTADTHRAIRFMVSQLGDRHSSFLTPEQAHQLEQTSDSREAPLPRGELLPERIAYLWLPYLIGDGATATDYAVTAHTIIRTLDEAQPCGWIVDLSENQGGNMWPMLVAAGPILGEGVAGSFVGPEGAATAWSYRSGQALMAQEVMAQVDDGAAYRLAGPLPPVAVLTDKRTASSGEAIAVAFRGRPHTRSFGAATAGLSTGNETYPLSDGAVLILTEAVFADRTGSTYGGRIEPDERAWFGRPARQAAIAWLLRQPACTRP